MSFCYSNPICNDEAATKLALEVLHRAGHVLVRIVERAQEVIEGIPDLKRDRALGLVVDPDGRSELCTVGKDDVEASFAALLGTRWASSLPSST